MRFEQYQKLIQGVARKVSASYGVEYDEMEAQGYLIYCECVRGYDMTKASFSTYLYICLSHRLAEYAEKLKSHDDLGLCDLANDDDEWLEDKSMALAVTDNAVTLKDLLDLAKPILSADAYSIFKWILGRSWERKGRRTPTMHTAAQALGWGRGRAQRGWDECKAFWNAEGVTYCC